MSDRDIQALYELTEDQQELLEKAILGENQRIFLTKHCIYIDTTTEEFSDIYGLDQHVFWNLVGSKSAESSDREKFARFISELPGNYFFEGYLKTDDQVGEWMRWRDRLIDFAKYFLAGINNRANPLLKERKAGIIDEETYLSIRVTAQLFDNWWQLVMLNEEPIKAALEKTCGYPFSCGRELVEEMIRGDIEGEFSNCLKSYYVYNSKVIRDIATLKHKQHRGELDEVEEQELYKLIDLNSAFPIWYHRVISVCEYLAERGNQSIAEHLAINGKIINRLSRGQFKRERSRSTSKTWSNGKLSKGIVPKWTLHNTIPKKSIKREKGS